MPVSVPDIDLQERPHYFRQPVIVLLAGVVLSALASIWVAGLVDRQVEARFHQLGLRQMERIQERFDLYAHGLRGARGFLEQEGETVTAQRFQRYATSRDLTREFPGTLAWGYAERLPLAQAAAHLRQRHNLNYRRLGNTENNSEAWVVRLAEPLSENSPALGTDLGSEEARRAAIRHALDTGNASLTAPITLVQDPDTPTGLLMLLPVYELGRQPAAVTGLVTVALRAGDMLGFLAEEPGLKDQLDIVVRDISAQPKMLYRLPPGNSSAHIPGTRLRDLPVLHAREEMTLGGRRWEVEFSGRPAIYTDADRWLPPLVFTLGSLISFLVTGLLLFSARLRQSAEDRARAMTTSLREREALLQSTLASLTEWVFVLDASDMVIDCHEPPQQSGWKTRNEFIGRTLGDSLPPAAAVQLQGALIETRQRDRAEFEFDIEEAGTMRRFVAKLTARRSSGELDGITVVAHDVTVERAQARELAESEQKFRLLFAEGGQAIMLTRHDRYVDANPAALRLFGVPNLAALQHANLGVVSPMVQPDGRLSRQTIHETMQRVISEGAQNFEWTFQRLSDGQTFPAEVHTSCLDINGEPHFLSTITDLSSHKLTESTLIQSRDAAEAATREKSEFLATMSHEIRTPMNGVLGMAQLLSNTPLNGEQQEYLNTIQQSGQALLTIINDILDFSKIEAGKLSFEEAPFDLQVALDETCELLLPQIREKDLQLQVRVDASTPLQVIGDAGRFRQILLNYLSNALKFTQHGGITVSLRAREAGRGAALYELSVADTGIGISPEKQELLFQKFAQADATTTRRFGGTGLGLAICKALVERMGGEVSMSSTPGHGSTFRATFWMSLDPHAPHQMLPVLLPALRHAGMLVMDRPSSHRDALLKGLEKSGLPAVATGSAAETLAQLRETPARFLLLDTEVAGKELLPLLQDIRHIDSMAHAVIMLVTTQPDQHDHAFCRAHNIAAYLPKPARLAWILSALNIIANGEHEGVVSRQTLSSHHARGKALPSLRQGIRVLLAEDNAVNQKVAARMLEKMGCHVDMVGNGLEALVMVAQFPYDVVLMDVQMPEMDGIAATRSLRSQGFAELPIIALTANNRDSDRQECRAAGMSDFLAKPIKYEDLHTCLGRWV
ncbi:MAG TPA: CHASE domain-containing protein [Moraxellaceae bacterium]